MESNSCHHAAAGRSVFSTAAAAAIPRFRRAVLGSAIATTYIVMCYERVSTNIYSPACRATSGFWIRGATTDRPTDRRIGGSKRPLLLLLLLSMGFLFEPVLVDRFFLLDIDFVVRPKSESALGNSSAAPQQQNAVRLSSCLSFLAAAADE
jgi:hypothetical protein